MSPDYTQLLEAIEAHLYNIEGCMAAILCFMGMYHGFQIAREFWERAWKKWI